MSDVNPNWKPEPNAFKKPPALGLSGGKYIRPTIKNVGYRRYPVGNGEYAFLYHPYDDEDMDWRLFLKFGHEFNSTNFFMVETPLEAACLIHEKRKEVAGDSNGKI